MTATPSNASKASTRAWIVPSLTFCLVVAVFVTLSIINSEVRAFLIQILTTCFSILSTPIILEITSILLACLALYYINSYRRRKNGEDWILLIEPTSISEAEPHPIEELLNQRQWQQAQALLDHMPSTDEQTHWQIRLLAAQQEFGEALQILQKFHGAHVKNRIQGVQSCIDSARWLQQHEPQSSQIREWLAVAKELHPIQFRDDDPLASLV